MKDQMVQVIFREYGSSVRKAMNCYQVDSIGELTRCMKRDLHPDWYAVATWINSVGDAFKVFIDGLGYAEITGEDGSIW